MNDFIDGSTPIPMSGRSVLVAGATGMLGRQVATGLHRAGSYGRGGNSMNPTSTIFDKELRP